MPVPPPVTNATVPPSRPSMAPLDTGRPRCVPSPAGRLQAAGRRSGNHGLSRRDDEARERGAARRGAGREREPLPRLRALDFVTTEWNGERVVCARDYEDL